MGKIRIKTIGDESQEEAEKKKGEVKRAEKLSRAKSTDLAFQVAFQGETLEPLEPQSEPSEQPEPAEQPQQPQQTQSPKEKTSKPKKAKFAKKARSRSSNYTAKVMEIDKNKTYSLSDALELLKKVHLAKFDETVELHINTTEAGISGQIKLPHGTGKEIRVAIATDELIEQIEKSLINFDVLIAAPSEMPKLAKVAKVLGPRGLMPNPKNGTISDNPQEAMKKFQGGQISFKTESKVPLMHLTVGKMSFGDEKLSENIQTIIAAIKKDRIQKVVLKSTMSPAIKLQV